MRKICQCIYGDIGDAEEKEREREAKELRKRSREIDKRLKSDGALFKQTIKLLLLGTGESGKSTVLKQMRIIHISKFSEQERLLKVNDIKSNIRDSILSILDAMERFKIQFESPVSQIEMLAAAREYVYDNIDLIFTRSSTTPIVINRQTSLTNGSHAHGESAALLLSLPSPHSAVSLNDVIAGGVTTSTGGSSASNSIQPTSTSAATPHLPKSSHSSASLLNLRYFYIFSLFLFSKRKKIFNEAISSVNENNH